MPEIANLNLPAAAANDVSSRVSSTERNAGNPDAGGPDADNAAPSSFQDSLHKAQAKTGADHKPGGKTLPETEAAGGKQADAGVAQVADEQQAEAVLTEASVLAPVSDDAMVLASNDADASDGRNPNAHNPLHPLIESSALADDAVAINALDANDRDTPPETDAEALAALPAVQANGLAQQAVKNIVANAGDAPPGGGNRAAAARLQTAMPSGAGESGANQSGAESDMLFKLSMQAIADAPASGLQGAVAQSSVTLSSVNTMQALLQPESALRADNPNLSATAANALLNGQNAGQGIGQTSTLSGGLTSTLMSGHIATPFGKPEWGEALGKQVLMMVNQNVRSAEIRMNPANLGPIEIQIDMQDEQVNVAFSSRHAVVREAMEQAMPRLREMLDANGLSLAESSVSDQGFAGQHEFAFADNRQDGERHASGFASPLADELPADIAVPVNMQALSSAMLDVYI